MDDIALYGLLNWGPDQSDRYVDEIADAVDTSARFPELGRRDEDIDPDLRSIAVGDHCILYQVGADAITDLRVVHHRMDPAHWMTG